jgi:hypothetical protein
MASPNPVTDERKMKNKDKIKLAKTKNPGDSCALRMWLLAKNKGSKGELLISNFLPETRLFWD